jgi:formamidopyrimidine-DNA glycosylase
MPELPDVESFRRYFEEHVLNRKIVKVEIAEPGVLGDMSSDQFEERIKNCSFKSTGRHGKYLLGFLDKGGVVVFHFGMTGSLQYSEKSGKPPSFARLLLGFSKGEFLAYSDPRKLGRIYWAGTKEEFISFKGLGPDALSSELNYQAFRKILTGRKGEVKAVLMDQHLIAGIGNVYSDEVLFQARIHPEERISELAEERLKRLFTEMKKVLKASSERYASSGNFPGFYLIPSRRKGRSCPRCGTGLEHGKLSGRTFWFCPGCQENQIR